MRGDRECNEVREKRRRSTALGLAASSDGALIDGRVTLPSSAPLLYPN
jgi:hypothetical protein